MATTIAHSNSDTVTALQSLELFASANEDVLTILADASEVLEFDAGHWVFREYDRAESFYVIMSGRVSLATCRPVVGCRKLTELGAGELLGWSPLARRRRLSASAIATEAATVLKIDAATITQLKQHHPEFFGDFIQQILEIVAQRLSATRGQILEICGVRLPQVQVESD